MSWTFIMSLSRWPCFMSQLACNQELQHTDTAGYIPTAYKTDPASASLSIFCFLCPLQFAAPTCQFLKKNVTNWKLNFGLIRRDMYLPNIVIFNLPTSLVSPWLTSSLVCQKVYIFSTNDLFWFFLDFSYIYFIFVLLQNCHFDLLTLFHCW